MKPYSLNLIEDKHSSYLAIDSSDKKEYIYKKKTGMLKKEYQQGKWVCQSTELKSVRDSGLVKSKEEKQSTSKKKKEDSQEFNLGKIIRKNGHILKFLEKLKVEEWKAIFRVNQDSRYIIRNGQDLQRFQFNYSSILVKIKVKQQRGYLEVGEGSVKGPYFNQSGLCTRITEIIGNHEESKNKSFSKEVPVILNSGDGAILFHEILGHSLEADYIYQGLSPFSVEDIGKNLISSNVNLVTHDPKDPFFRKVICDDEGEVPKSCVLIKNGKVKNFISDCFYKNLLNIKNCGNSRMEDFTKKPIPRMYALYLKPGKYHPEELISSTKYGIYAKEFGEGNVYFNRNAFVFNIKEAFLIENGKRTAPLGSVLVRGDIIDTLNSIEMVANDFRYDKGNSYCHKDGQTVNVRVGQPTVKIKKLWVTKGDK
jgi:predicted Zn-dependent protease